MLCVEYDVRSGVNAVISRCLSGGFDEVKVMVMYLLVRIFRLI